MPLHHGTKSQRKDIPKSYLPSGMQVKRESFLLKQIGNYCFLLGKEIKKYSKP